MKDQSLCLKSQRKIENFEVNFFNTQFGHNLKFNISERISLKNTRKLISVNGTLRSLKGRSCNFRNHPKQKFRYKKIWRNKSF